MKILVRILALARLLIIPALRNPLAYIVVFTAPAIFMYLYWVVGGMRFGQHVLYGSLVAMAINAGIVTLPQRVLEYRFRRLQDMFVASPLDQMSYMFGHAVSRLLHVAPGCLLVLGILISQGQMPVSRVPIVAFVLALSWASGCAIGFTLATYVSSGTQLSALANLVGMAMVLLPPVMYPLDLIAARWQWLAILAPSSSAAQIIASVGGSGGSRPQLLGLCWIVVGVWLGLCLALISRKSQWREP